MPTGRLFALCTLLLTALFPATVFAQLGDLETYKKRKVGAEPPAIEAIIARDIEELQRLWVRQRAYFHDRGKLHRSVFHVAAIIGDTRIIDFLVEKDLNPNALDEAGNNALHYAAQQGDADTLQRLIDAGGTIDAQNNNGEVPLFHAVRSGKWETLKILLDAGADTQITDYTARNIWDYAKESKNRKILRQLQQYGL